MPRCVGCDNRIPYNEGCDDALERMVQDPAWGGARGLCDSCWCAWDAALQALVCALFGWLAPPLPESW